MNRAAGWTVVVPTLGRPSLGVLLTALAAQQEPLRAPVLLVDDRPPDGATAPLALEGADELDVHVLTGGGRGPAHARNVGWRRARTPWIVFLDDDVVPAADWSRRLADDIATTEAAGAIASQARLRVPLPADRAPSDWERNTQRLEDSAWITADLVCRRDALSSVGGFDERFRRAFREDADLALRLGADQGTFIGGTRQVEHPVRPADRWVSLRSQRGNADDQLMRALHGPHWRRRARERRGRILFHLATTGAGLTALSAAATGRRRTALTAAVAWLVATGEFSWARLRGGRRDAAEVGAMLATSALIPPLAVAHLARGWWRHRGARPWRGAPDLVLFDRDGTLVEDVPYNGDPQAVTPVPGAPEALGRLRAEGIAIGLVTNQSGVARGLLTEEQVVAVNRRVAELLGPFDDVQVCLHGPEDGCGCRKPGPAMIERACDNLGASPERTLMVGDIASDVAAARTAGATGILVPNQVTRAEEVEAEPGRAADLAEVVERCEAGTW